MALDLWSVFSDLAARLGENDAILAQYRTVVAQANDKFSIVSAYEGLEIPLGDGT